MHAYDTIKNNIDNENERSDRPNPKFGIIFQCNAATVANEADQLQSLTAAATQHYTTCDMKNGKVKVIIAQQAPHDSIIIRIRMVVNKRKI